ncbi:MAG: HIT family protein [Planctomycetes bacterium]|nr:HIT family protein [Planctomycetota bacterium]
MDELLTENCPFCDLPPESIICKGRHFKAVWDNYPVSTGHALLIPNRHVPNWFDASPEEQADVFGGISSVREIIDELHSPDGYNIGINIGEAAGQTVFHLHVHLIPRYVGDMVDPTGGVRHVIPERGNYRQTR